MSGERVIIPFPSDTIRLNGILLDTLTTIRCATENLTYREYVGADSTFLVVSYATILDALKSISMRNELTFDTKAAATFALKNMHSMSDEIALTAILIMSIEKTVSLQHTCEIDSSMIPAALKFIQQLDNSFSITSDVKTFLAKLISVASSSLFASDPLEFAAAKTLTDAEVIWEIFSAADMICLKYAGTIIDSVQFSSIVKFSVDRYRLLKDIDGLYFSDIDNWTMDFFDTIQT